MLSEQTVKMAAIRLRSFTLRASVRPLLDKWLGIPESLSDGDALRVLGEAIKLVEGQL